MLPYDALFIVFTRTTGYDIIPCMEDSSLQSAQRKREGRRRILLLADFAYASGKAIASGVIRFVSAHPGIELLLHGRTSEMPLLRRGLVPDSGIDGIVSCIWLDNVFLRALKGATPCTPMVFASLPRGWRPRTKGPSASIFCDQTAIAKAAAELLLSHGHSEFGYVGSRYPDAARTWDAERREAFRDIIAEHGFTATSYSPPPETDADSELASLAAWLLALPKPCGLLVSDDIRAMHVLNVCRAERIAVPEQIQVIGTDNEEWICEHTSPTLTSVEPDFEGCGRLAAETLLAMMDGRSWKPVQTFGVRCVEQRMSTTDMHGSVKRAILARKWLRANCGERIECEHVAAQFGCSTRMLQTSYKSVFGKSMQDDLIEMRLERAKKLLADTESPVCHIPELCGLEATSYFMRLFKARTGMTMLQWRRTKGAR
jgi:LacI family transcriptional regulator